MRDTPDRKDRPSPPASPFEEEFVFSEQETLRVRQGLEYRMRGLADESPFLQASVEKRPLDTPMDDETAAPAFTEVEDLTAEFEAETDWEATAPWQPEYESEMESETDEAETPEVIDEAEEYDEDELYAVAETADWQDAEDGAVDWEKGEANDEDAEIEAENSFERYQLPCDDLERIPTDYEGEFEELFDEESGITPDDKRIDVRAKFALPKMLKRPDMQADAQRLIMGIKSGKLAGIYGNDLGIAVKIAKTHNRNRFQLIPKGEDGSLVLSASVPLNAPPTVFFRGDDPDISKQSQRFYSALQKASQTFQLWQTRLIRQCTLADKALITNLVPSAYCRTGGKKQPTSIVICREPQKDNGAYVKWIQVGLGSALGISRQPTGRFSLADKKALEAFQKKYKLPVSGKPDLNTYLKLRSLAASNTSVPCIPRARAIYIWIKLCSGSYRDWIVRDILANYFERVILASSRMLASDVFCIGPSSKQNPYPMPVICAHDLVIYLFGNRDDSIIRKKYPQLFSAAGNDFPGLTYVAGSASAPNNETISEVYLDHRANNAPRGLANMIFHELMHNKLQMKDVDLHTLCGAGSTAIATGYIRMNRTYAPMNTTLTDCDIRHMASSIHMPVRQYLGHIETCGQP